MEVDGGVMNSVPSEPVNASFELSRHLPWVLALRGVVRVKHQRWSAKALSEAVDCPEDFGAGDKVSFEPAFSRKVDEHDAHQYGQKPLSGDARERRPMPTTINRTPMPFRANHAAHAATRP